MFFSVPIAQPSLAAIALPACVWRVKQNIQTTSQVPGPAGAYRGQRAPHAGRSRSNGAAVTAHQGRKRATAAGRGLSKRAKGLFSCKVGERDGVQARLVGEERRNLIDTVLQKKEGYSRGYQGTVTEACEGRRRHKSTEKHVDREGEGKKCGTEARSKSTFRLRVTRDSLPRTRFEGRRGWGPVSKRFLRHLHYQNTSSGLDAFLHANDSDRDGRCCYNISPSYMYEYTRDPWCYEHSRPALTAPPKVAGPLPPQQRRPPPRGTVTDAAR